MNPEARNRGAADAARTNGHRKLVRIPVILMALVGSMVPFAGPASAAVPGLVRIAATSAPNSSDGKGVTASCPAGKQLVGVGGRIGGGSGEVVMDDIRPNGSTTTAPTAVTVYAYETDPYDPNWTVTAFAICADPLPGLVRISATSVSDSLNAKGVTATCPTGKSLVGAGGQISGALGEVLMSGIVPNGSPTVAPTAVRVSADEESAYGFNWYVTAYAICANPIPGLVRVSATSDWDSLDSKSVIARCPNGKALVGAAGSLVFSIDDVGAHGFGTVALQAITPYLPEAPRVVLSGYEEDLDTSDWALRAFAICATA